MLIAEHPRLPMKTLLIADDHQHKIDLIQSMLTHFKWHPKTVIAMTTEDAMKLIDEHTISHAFIDYYIPSENGPAIIRYLKEKRPEAHCVLVSSSNNASNYQEATDAGAEGCICTSDEADAVEQAFGEVMRKWEG